MKKIINFILLMALFFNSFLPFPYLVTASTCNYSVKELMSDGRTTDIGCYEKYSDAKNKMLAHDSTQEKVAVIYDKNNRRVNAKYAIAKLDTRKVIPLYPSASSSVSYTSVASSYGRDSAFIDYDPSSNRVKVKISGYAGWTSINNVSIIPISELYTSKIRITSNNGINVRSDHKIADNKIGVVLRGTEHNFYEKKIDSGYTWYRIKYQNKDGWVASQGSTWLTEGKSLGLQTYYLAYKASGNLLHYYEHEINRVVAQGFTNLSKYPSFMEDNEKYYSFDGNYFYVNIMDMLDDYRVNSYKKSINYNNPHHAYFMYLPTHSKTGYTADDFNQRIKSLGYSRNKDPKVQYVRYNEIKKEYEFVPGISRSGISLLYNQGNSLVNVANQYGINALMMLSTAINESGTGTSLIAFLKNNLFGLGAVDSDPVNGARSYATVKDSFIDFAKFTGSSESNYSNPNNLYYYGSHYGNKASGMNVYYATDPYWGEKQAMNSRETDADYGGQDFMANTIGVKVSAKDVAIKKEPRDNSSTIYLMKNNNQNKSVENIPVIVFDKVYTTINGVTTGWYKVYTDTALDKNQNIAKVDYDFNKSYGYIKDSDLYVWNNQPTINASDISVNQGDVINLLSGVTAYDKEDGNLTSRITYSGDYDIDVPGDYKIVYEVEDNNRFQASKEVTLTVTPTMYPVIQAVDVEVSQFTKFEPKKIVKATDYRDGDLTDSIEIVNEVNTNIKGDYTVTYRVMNSLGYETTKTINVKVVENAKPVINANNQTILIRSNYDPLVDVTATDKEDGNLTDKIQVVMNDVDISKIGTYKVEYLVIDSVGQETRKEIYVTVQERNYKNRTGQFYFEQMSWNKSTNKLDVSGYLAITGMNNTKKENIVYDLVLKDNYSKKEFALPLERWLEGHPSRQYSDSTYNYSDTWFKGNVSLSSIPAGEYTMYIRARSGNFESINLFRNMLGKEMTRKATDNNGRGYLFRNNNYSREYPIELFVRDNGLISSVEPPHSSNMFTSYRSISFDNRYLNIIGNSYNINGNYSSSSKVERYLIIENNKTFERFIYNIGSIVGDEIPLRQTDNLSKVRAWFDTKNKVDISKIPEGNYAIYIRTKSGKVDDFGELNDIFLKNITAKTTINNKEYSLSLNKDSRFRIELNVINK